LGRALVATAPSSVELYAPPRRDLDVGDAAQVDECVSGFVPELIINAAAYTAVDRAETEQAAARRTNVSGVRNLVRAASACRLIHVSTDFVFNGKASSPYQPSSDTEPLSVYGATKLDGEREALSASNAVVVRTAWVYSAEGRNFLLAMLRLMRERGTVRVVSDQIGTPTSATSLALAIWKFSDLAHLSGIYHWTDAGVASWYDFAVAIAEEAEIRDLLRGVTVVPIASEDYPTAATRPRYSVLESRATISALGVRPAHWRQSLRKVLDGMVVTNRVGFSRM
jgi:dTDP-4-dehydrorhamnose reductase